jgi:nucleoid-associated protein YgaU
MGNYTDKRGDKRLIHILIFVIVLLLIAAIVIIVYLSSRMMEMQQQSAKTESQARQEVPLSPPAPVKEAIAKAVPSKLATEDIATIVQLVMTQMQKSQPPASASTPASAVAQPSTPTSAPVVEVVQSVPDPQSQIAAPSSTKSALPETPLADDSTDELESMIDVLGSVDVDTVEEKPVDLSTDNATTLTQTRASKTSQKANDNFNKVVVSDDGTDDFAQLGSEIDQLMQEGDAPESGYEKEMKREVVERQNEMRTIVVREGDTLISIARKAYGDGQKYTTILRANPGIIKNPDRIFVGQVLRVPK